MNLLKGKSEKGASPLGRTPSRLALARRTAMRLRLSPVPDGPVARPAPENPARHRKSVQGAPLDRCHTGDIHPVANWKRSGMHGNRPRVSAVLRRCLCQWEVRTISPLGFCPSFFAAAVRESRPPLSKARSASASRRILKRSTPAASMISSLCPSQKTSVSINHAAGRRHMEHSMPLMGLTSNTRGTKTRSLRCDIG